MMGVMFVFGVFDIRNGSIDLIGVNTQINPNDIHSELVQELHFVALDSVDTTYKYNQLTPEGSIDQIKDNVNNIQIRLKALNKLISKLDNYNDKSDIVVNYETYKNVLESWLNHYLKIFTFFEQRGLNQENIDSFKESINNLQNNLNTAHNTYIEILNSAR